VKYTKRKVKYLILTMIFTLAFLSIFTIYKPADYLSQAEYKKALAPRVLYWGSTGQDVKNVQWQLVKWGYLVGSRWCIWPGNL